MVIPIPTPDHFKFHSHFRPGLKPHSHPRKHSLPSQSGVESTNTIQTSYRPGGGETICPPPMTVRLAADLRPSADESAPRASLVAVVWIGPDFAHKIGCHGNVLWGVEQLPLDCSSTVIQFQQRCRFGEYRSGRCRYKPYRVFKSLRECGYTGPLAYIIVMHFSYLNIDLVYMQRYKFRNWQRKSKGASTRNWTCSVVNFAQICDNSDV